MDDVKENPITARCAIMGLVKSEIQSTMSPPTAYKLGAKALKLPSYTPLL